MPSKDTQPEVSAMKGEPMELLQDLVRLAKAGADGSKADTGKGGRTRKRAPPQQPDEAAILSIINSVQNQPLDEEDKDEPSSDKLLGEGADDAAKLRLAKRLAEAISSGSLAVPKKRPRKSL